MADTNPRDTGAQSSGSQDGSPQDEEIRSKVRDLTTQALKSGHMDPKGVEDVVRTVTAGIVSAAEQSGIDARRALLESLPGLDQRLKQTAQAAHKALHKLGSKGVDFTENDIKEAFVMLQDLHKAYVETVAQLANAASGGIQTELRALAGSPQQMGAEAGARAASVMTEFANRITAASMEGASTGLNTARDYSVRMSLLASGVLAGIADALREPSSTDKQK